MTVTLCELVMRSLFAPFLFFFLFLPIMGVMCALVSPIIFAEEFPKTNTGKRLSAWWATTRIFRAYCNFKNRTCKHIDLE